VPAPSPVNSACNCCEQPYGGWPLVQAVTVSQVCNAPQCGELPCSNSKGVYGDCTFPETTCNPNWEDLSNLEKCAAKRYLVVTTVDENKAGNSFSYSYPVEGSPVTCNGTVNIISGEQKITETTTYFPEANCGTSFDRQCEGQSSSTITEDCTADENGAFVNGFFLTCESTYKEGENQECGWFGEESGYFQDGSSKFPFENEIETSCSWYTDGSSCIRTVTYTEPNKIGICSTLPEYPPFWDKYGQFIQRYCSGLLQRCDGCVDDYEDPPDLKEGQTRIFQCGHYIDSDFVPTPADIAYNYTNPYNEAIKSIVNAKFRIEHRPTGTCYLKAWFRKRVQNWKIGDCESPVDPEPDGDQCGCWSMDGEPTYVDLGIYEWQGQGYPCYADNDKVYDHCNNWIVDNSEWEIIAGTNQSVSIEVKWSAIRGYEPNWYPQGCKPNGFPLVNEECV